jgi:hypothetical protein
MAVPALNCTLAAPGPLLAGQPVRLQFSLQNGGLQPVQLLVWGTPFEAHWFAPYLAVQRDQKTLPYGGAAKKRGDPQATDYLRLEPGQARSVTFDMAPAFEVVAPGRYVVQPQIRLHDVVEGDVTVPRPRDQHTGLALDCPVLAFEIAR